MNSLTNLVLLLGRGPGTSSSETDLEIHPIPTEEDPSNDVVNMPQLVEGTTAPVPMETEEDAIESPRFSNLEHPQPQDVQDNEILEMPSLSPPSPQLVPKESAEEEVLMPHFHHHIAPQQQHLGYSSNVEMPQFALFSEPKSRESESESIDAPHFETFPSPRSLPQPQKPFIHMPELSRYRQPDPPRGENRSLELPRFSRIQTPRPLPIDKIDECAMPEFFPFSSPPPKEPKSTNLPLPDLSLPYHPVVEDFDKLTRTMSYQQICLFARQHGTQGDVNMLKHQKHLRTRFINNVFQALIEKAPSLLPKSPNFKRLLENDQLQLNLLATFCRDLMEVNHFEELDRLLTLEAEEWGNLPFIPHLSECGFESDLAEQLRLLKFKENIHCFLVEILNQEREAASKFGATPKDVTTLESNLKLLATHIEKKLETLRMREIHAAESLDFSLWEDRKVVPPADIKMDLPDLDGIMPDNSIQALTRGLLTLQVGKPKAYELKEFTHAVLSLDTSDFTGTCRKAKYLLELGKIYSNLPGMPALNRALAWYDLAITTIQSHPEATPTNRLLLECYEYRALLKLKKVEELKKTNPVEETLPRQGIDESSRDFQISSPLEEGLKENFVRKFQNGKADPKLDTGLTTIGKAIKGDDDYAEARYQQFLKEFQQLQLDSSKMLHHEFERLANGSEEQMMGVFKLLLCRSSHLPDGVIMKLKVSSGTLFVKSDAQGIMINREGKEVLTEILTKGIKKVSIHDPKKGKVYFCQRIKQEDLCEAVRSLANYEKRLKQIEKGIQIFHDFEIRALYKMSLKNEEEKIDCDSMRNRLRHELIQAILDLDKIAIEGYLLLGKRSNKGKAKKVYPKALPHLCRAIANCDRLLAYSDDQELKERRLDLITKRAFVYKKMELWNCYCADLEEAIAIGKRDNPRFCKPSLHYALGIVYRRFGRIEAAKEQFYIVQSTAKGRDKGLSRKGGKQLREIANAKKVKKKKSNAQPPDENEILAKFQDQNIREECLQIIRDHYQANGKVHLNRNVPYWDTFVASIGATTSIKQFCEVIHSSIHLSPKISGQNLLRIANLSNVTLKDPKTLDEIKKYLQDALRAYQEEKKCIEDDAIAELEKTKAEHAREQAFVNFRENLKTKLKDGELLRPGSKKREAISTLAVHLRGTEMDSAAIIKSLKEIVGDEHVSDTLVFTPERIVEIAEILEVVLDKVVPPFKKKEHVLQIYGNNIFLSEIKIKIEQALQADPTIRDVHVMGLQVYMDTSIKLAGINLALGGEYVQFMPYKGLNAREEAKKITIDLRGKPGDHGADLNLPAAANGRGLSEKGSDGKEGNDGNGGQPGGDFCIEATKMLVGVDDQIIEKIYLNGGEAGRGSRGQDGGKGRDGVQGEDGRDGVRDGDLADSSWGYIDRRDGKGGYRAGDGGEGGTGGRGGEGGKTGHLLIDKGKEAFNGILEEKPGGNGADGDPGQGGAAGKPERDGMDRLYVKGGLFHSRKSIWGMKVDRDHRYGDREKEGWKSTITIQQSIDRNQGKAKGRGKTAEEANKRRRSERKNGLKQEMFQKGLSHHIHTQSAENKAGAFDEVTSRLAVVAETEKVMMAQLNALQKRIGDIETLHQTTATILQQTQVQQNAQVQHSRLATFNPVEKTSSLKKEINVFFNNSFRDKENLLPFLSCSPVAHDMHSPHAIESAIHTVNMSRGQNCHALAELIDEITHLTNEEIKYVEKRTALINKLAEIIEKMPLKYTVDGFSEIVEASDSLQEADLLKQVIAKKEEEVIEFKENLEEERGFVNSQFESEIQQMTMKVGLQKFLYRMLFLIEKSNHPDAEKRKQWFDKALYQRIIRCARQVMDKEPSSEIIQEYFTYVHERIRAFSDNPPHSGKEIRKKMVSERKAIQKNVKKLRFNQGWILEHLTELCDSNISPMHLWQGRKEGGNLDDFYLACSREWANIFSDSSQGGAPDDPSFPPRNDEDESDTMQWIQSIKQGDWDAQKLTHLEKRVKDLKALEGKLGNLHDYLAQLHQIYLDPMAQEELAEIYITLLQTDRNPQESLQFIREIKDLKDHPTLDQWRKKFPHFLINTNFTDLRERKLADLIDLYLQTKHLELTKTSCVTMLSEEFTLLPPQQKELENVIQSLLKNVNTFYAVQSFLPEKNFFAIAEELIHELKGEIVASIRSKSEPETQAAENNQKDPPEMIDRILLRIVKDKITLDQVDDHAQLLALLQSAELEGNFDALRASLFVLVNTSLSYSENLKVIKILNNKKIAQGLTKLQKALLKLASECFNQKIASQQATFKMQWQAVLEKGREYDERRQLVDQEDGSSVEKLLMDIAQDADLLDPDQKIEILDQMITIITSRGCVTSISQLQSLRNQLIMKKGQLPQLPDHSSETVNQYNQALVEVFNTHDLRELAKLPPLFMAVFDQEIDDSFLLPTFLAIEHLPLEAKHLILLMKKIGRLSPESGRKRDLKEKCLDQIRSLLIQKIQKKSQEVDDHKKRVKEALHKAQTDLLTQISPIIKESDALHSERHIAKIELWLLRLDHYFEIEKMGDPNGDERRKIYGDLVNVFMTNMQNTKTIEEGLVIFHQWLRDTLNQKKDSNYAINAGAIQKLLNDLENSNNRQEALKKLEMFYWRGILPYGESQEKESILKHLQNLNFDQKNPEIIHLLKRLKLKFDDAMIQEECTEIRSELETFEQNHQEGMQAWLSEMEEWLASQETPIHEIERKYPNVNELKQKAPVFNRVNLGRHFSVNGVTYFPKNTVGDGACSIHALLGEQINGVYRYLPGNPKGRFCDVLSAVLDSPQDSPKKREILNLYETNLSNLLDAVKSDRSAKQIFGQNSTLQQRIADWRREDETITREIKELRMRESQAWATIFENQMPETLNQHPKLLGKSQQAICEYFRNEPQKGFNIITEEGELIRRFLAGHPQPAIQVIRDQIEEHARRRHQKRQDLLKSPSVRENYFRALNESSYYLNTLELQMGAYLFDLQVQVFTRLRGTYIPADVAYNPTAPNKVFILQQDLHFERCLVEERSPQEPAAPSPSSSQDRPEIWDEVKNDNRSKEKKNKKASHSENGNEGDNFNLSQWLMEQGRERSQDAPSGLKEGRPQIEQFLQDLEEDLTNEEVNQEKLILLKKLKQVVYSVHDDPLLTRIHELEGQIISQTDQQESARKERIQQFISLLNRLNAFQPPAQKESQDPFVNQYLKDLAQFEKAVESSRVLMGDEQFFLMIEHISSQLKGYQGRINLQMLSNLFWVIPRLNDQQVAFEILEAKLPDHWTMALLEWHCLESFLPALSQRGVPSVKTHDLSEQEKEDLINKMMNEREMQSAAFLESFKGVLKRLKEAKEIGVRDKETLLRLIASRLAKSQETKLDFPVEDFTALLEKYLVSPCVLKKLAVEFSQPYSALTTLLLQPSFESFKHALTRAWIRGMLEPHRLEIANSQKLYDSLFEIESKKKTETMQKVVESLHGGLMTPAVVECIANFADKSWELDETTLDILKKRDASGQWYSSIDAYTKIKRSEKRDLKKLVALMEQEKLGINQSIKEMLEGEEPQLVKDIQDIERKFKEGICHYDAAAIKAWAHNNRSTRFFDDPEKLKEGIAMVSRANELFTEENKDGNITKGYSLRHTQMIALWLMLRKGTGEPKGRISQMFTGEGKSITFASLAVLKAMSKSHVDVITTSVDLAERDALEMKGFYEFFDLTVSNNCDQACDQDEEERKKRYFCDGKPVDIIYGDSGSFERDILLTEFHGKGIIHPERLGPNRSVLVDEVDGLFLDNAGMVLYLSHNVDSLRFLERIFTQIWTTVNQPNLAHAYAFDDKAVEAVVTMMKEKLKLGEIQLPTYELPNAKYVEIKAVIERKLPIWVRSALYAKMISDKNEYVINDRVVGRKVKREIIAMDKGTGIEQFSLKWSQGLHQFLQLKHGLELSPDSLKAVFLSNYFFFKRYGQNIYGLSGTLGSDAEQKYLQNLYGVDLCKIPRFAGEKYIQNKAVVAGTREEWLTSIEKSIDRQVKERKRAVLLICDSIDEVMALKDQLKERYPSSQVYTSYLDKPSFVAKENASRIGPGDILIATNLAGRGTDLKTTKQLEANGGLHVIVSYLPSNIRIEEQAFGRTARSGNEGSGEFIILDPQRRDIRELCRIRDWEEKQRLEAVATREVKKNEFEHELLRGFTYKGEKISGFQSILESIQTSFQGEESFYREAQLNSLKNRWAFWMDHMEEKIKMVHAIGKEMVVASFKEFEKGVYSDLQAGGHKLVKEPCELIKLGSEYRRKEMWSQAQACYAEAAKDPHYRYVMYYEAACEFIQSPSSSFEAKQMFKKKAKEAMAAIKPEIAQLQTSVQNITPIVEKYRSKGQADRGNPYRARSEEKIQIWSIFLSAIDGAIGGAFSEESFKKSSFVDGNRPQELIGLLGNRFKPMRLSKKLTVGEEDIFYKGEPLSIPKMYKPMLQDFKAIEAISGVRKIDKQAMLNYCAKVVTRDSVKQHLNCGQTIYQLSSNPIPPNFDGWPKEPQYTDQVKFVLSSLVGEIVGEYSSNQFSSHDEIKAKLKEKLDANDFLKNITVDSFFQTLLNGKFVVTDVVVDLSDLIVQVDGAPRQFNSVKELKSEGFAAKVQTFPKELQKAIFKAALQKNEQEVSTTWSLNTKIQLGHLALPQSNQEAADILWTFLEDKGGIKASKLKIGDHDYSKQSEKIKEEVKNYLRHAFPEDKKLEEAVDSIFGIIDSGIGMIYKLDNKKTTAEFADIVRKYFDDHKQHAPEGLEFFIELGLEVIADLVEKKDPPAWFEVLAVTVMGVIQMVAGVIIKAYLPVVGDLIGNALISTGMDDVMFAITSAVSGQFSWDDYAAAKVQSLKRSIISSAITCGVSFGVDAIGKSSVAGAWDAVNITGAERATQAATVAGGTFNLGTHILKEVGRNFLNMGISQLASRGIEGMTKLIAGSYDAKIREGIENAVNSQWHHVVAQADALYQKVGGDPSAMDNIDECITIALKRIAEDNFFDGAIRASRQVLPQAASLIGNSGWSAFVSHAPDIANLGVSIPKLVNLVEDGVRQLSRQIRETKDRKTEAAAAANSTPKASFDSDLQKRKAKFAEKLIDSFNGVLNGAVFAPLTSMGAQALAQLSKDALIPLSQQEKWAQSPEQLAKILEAKENGNEALADQLLLAWRGASDEVIDLSPEELQQTPLNSAEKIENLKQQYGDLLKVYKDKEGHLYVQRPNRQEYAASMEVNQPINDPALVALTHVVKKKVALRSPAGSSKVYSPDGNIAPLEIEAIDPLEIERVDNDAKSQGDTVTLDIAQIKDFKTLLEACRSQGIAMDDDPLSFKEKIASTLGDNEECKRFFHNWSLSDGDKSFAAENPIQEGNPLLRRAKGMLHGAIDYGVNTIQYYQTIAAHMGIGRPPLTSNPLQLVDPAVREEYNQQWIEAVTHLQAYDKQGIDNSIMKKFSINPQDPLYQSYREWTEFTLDHMGTVRDAYHSIKDIFGAGKNIGGRTHITDSNPKNEIKFFDSPSSSEMSHRTRYPHSDIWKHETEFQGIRVFQRDDLIDPSRIHPKTGETNLQRMQRGRAPIGPDGKEINLHHTIQRQGYPMAEVSGSFHKKHHGTIHVNPSTIPSGIPRNVHGHWREKYWIERARDFIPKKTK